MTLDELKTHCLSCTECELCKARTQVVFGVGNPAADILLIGEGPGDNEGLQGQPFVGRSGKLLDQFLESIDLSREKNVYIANMVKCRPPKNRDPKPEEQEACLHWLREQFKIIRPRLVICVGRIAAQRLIDKAFRVTRQHGEFIDKNGHYKGGCISPGLQMRLKSLRAFTAKLPLIDSEGPLLDIGYDTETSIRSGVIQGMKFEIEGRIKYFQEKYPSLLVFLTGGDIFNFDSKIKNLIFADKYIVPRGLNRILAFNNEQS